MKVYIRMLLHLLPHLLDEILIVLVGVGICKGKFNPALMIVFKGETQFWFIGGIVLYRLFLT